MKSPGRCLAVAAAVALPRTPTATLRYAPAAVPSHRFLPPHRAPAGDYLLARCCARRRALALLPGQMVAAPAGNISALMMFVKFALKPMQDVENFGESGVFECRPGIT